MNEIEAAFFYGVSCQFNEITGEIEVLGTTPHEEIFDLDVPF